jgi:cephalosporin hydroxylase
MRAKLPGAVRRAVVPRADELVLRRYRTLAARGARSRKLERATVRAFRALAEGDLSGERPSAAARRAVVEQFHRLYYHSSKQTWQNTEFLGTRVWKNPMDLWLYQELIHEHRPDWIIEAGTKFGGSAYYFARLFDLIGHGQVVTIDVTPQPGRPEHPRITYLEGSSTDPAIFASVDELVGAGKPLIVLDSWHRSDHVLDELRLWSPRVPVGSHIVVEDTHAGGHPVTTRKLRGGPWAAVERFLAETDDFVVDESMHKFFFSFNPRGYLKRVR